MRLGDAEETRREYYLHQNYVPTFSDLRLKSNVTGTKYDFMPYGDDDLLGDHDLFNQTSDYCLTDTCS